MARASKSRAKKSGAAVSRKAIEQISSTVVEEESPRVLVISGPNLDRLGKREPHIYGSETLEQIHERLVVVGEELGVAVDCRQSSHEGTLVEWVGSAEEEGFSAILLNAGAYTHTSIALYDALRASALPAVEVHLSNPAAREPFRHHSCIAAACIGTVSGFRGESYIVALWAVISAALRRLGAEPEPEAPLQSGARKAGTSQQDKARRNKRRSA